MTKPKLYPYQIQYEDNTYRMVDWTKAEFKLVGEAIAEQKHAIVLEDGIFKLTHVRAVVSIPEPEVVGETEEEKKSEGQLTEWGFVDADTALWLKAQGIDLTGGVN